MIVRSAANEAIDVVAVVVESRSRRG